MSWVFLNITNGNISLLRPSVIFNTIKVSNVEHFENDVTIMFFCFFVFSCIISINSLDLFHFISLESYNFIFLDMNTYPHLFMHSRNI